MAEIFKIWNTYIAPTTDSGMDLGASSYKFKNLYLSGKYIVGTTTSSVTGPTDDLDVSEIGIIFIDTSGNNVTLGGFTNGISGQVIHLTIIDTTNDFTIEHNEGTGNQDIFLRSGADCIFNNTYGGTTLVCNGTNWYETGY